ncbi:opioid growth factor receptor-related protein [Acinetobacter sp. OYA S30]|uniref:opioid growth factor receptor-related protein n=1 Tax=Acinetobacter sp. OYA S30 TaxID=3084921 RepID=UPI00298F0BBF|nr:opioid growth factor receptor-related protein [Acinetobacter sp. OYA S30]MDW8490727.1 opioid growth factor receptor-related protein [Acinetobacter sp. OYA S30]
MNKINDVILFNEGKISCHVNNYKINELLNSLSRELVLSGYYYIQWLLPVIGDSKWHTNTKKLSEDDFIYISGSKIANENILRSVKTILLYFNISLDDDLCLNSSLDVNSSYWLSGIGHVEKKLSRIMLCLFYLDNKLLAFELRDLSICLLQKYGFKTKKSVKETIVFWESIFDMRITY